MRLGGRCTLTHYTLTLLLQGCSRAAPGSRVALLHVGMCRGGQHILFLFCMKHRTLDILSIDWIPLMGDSRCSVMPTEYLGFFDPPIGSDLRAYVLASKSGLLGKTG